MLVRGKFCSLTLINWNGFFARTFELDNLVTTLSGGNGAGKSTTMAAFVTALIPDLMLLHFRNTTETGTSVGSSDKGLYGKLRSGNCYSVIEAFNSQQQRLLFGVRLQQISGREGKIDLKPFLLQDCPKDEGVLSLFTEKLPQKSEVRIRPLNAIKNVLASYDSACHFKAFNSITDYHAALFDLGVIPKRLVAGSDRQKFYRLIEASLYGGISSAITRSLRDYLLPDNGGVRKAFQNMEAALRENRLTLAAIQHTQADRDLFKQLMLQATHYVAADYGRQRNQRQEQTQQFLACRRTLKTLWQQLEVCQQQISQEQQRLLAQQGLEAEWRQQLLQMQQDYQQAQWVEQQQKKIKRCQGEEVILQEQLEGQQRETDDAHQQLQEADEQLARLSDQLDSLKSQLADQQQALDQQQVRAVRYRHAMEALAQARTICQQPELQPDDASQYQVQVQQNLQVSTEQLLTLSQQLSVAETAVQQFSQACQQIARVVGKDLIAPSEAYTQTIKLREQLMDQQRLADTLPWVQQQLADCQQRLLLQQQAQQLWQCFCQQQSVSSAMPSSAALLTLLQQQQQAQQELTEQLAILKTQQFEVEQNIVQLTQELQQQQRRVPTWLAAQEALNGLSQHCQQPLTNSQAISEQLQQLRQTQQQWLRKRESLQQQQQLLAQQIAELHQSGGVADNALMTLAEQLGGSLLSEIYEEIPLEKAPYYSALYGPARQAIVVTDLDQAQQKLAALSCSLEDLYLIEGNPQAFDEQLFEAHAYANGVMVQLTNRQRRYSRLPEVPLFGRRAREQRLQVLREQQQTLALDYRECSQVVQQGERLQQAFNQFISHHLAIAFTENPQTALQQTKQQWRSLEQQQQQLVQRQTTLKKQQQQCWQAEEQLNALLPLAPLLVDQVVSEQLATFQDSVALAHQAKQWVEQHAPSIQQLIGQLSILQQPPQPLEQIKTAYQQQQQQQRQLEQQRFALAEVVQRADHFDFPVEDSNQDLQTLNQHLRQRLAMVETSQQQVRQQQQQWQHQARQQHQHLTTLRTTLATKQQWREELQQELEMLPPAIVSLSLSQAQQHCQALQQAIENNQQTCQDLTKRLVGAEQKLVQLKLHSQQQQQQQRQQRQQLLAAKKRWSEVQQFARNHGLLPALQKPIFIDQSADDLRSISDRALGVLRQVVADNDHLRDALRASEGPSALLKKLQFYRTVYQHLQQRIRQDILQTDDPLQAIEQMEVELDRLTAELTAREGQLFLSSKGVATIIRKTIQREQSRIQLLNQGLQQVTFGQVRGVRLVVNIHDSHERLLSTLADPTDPCQELFTNRQLAFSEALATLYQRLTPQFDSQSRSTAMLGESLLDYRYYLDLKVEIFRDSEGWLQAESGTLSTGEAIGTGMAILMMVVQSWEEESARLRGRDNLPCRLLFLDEASRLDGQSISTLFELCERLQTQLLIAAPENIHPEQGTTYKLVRKLFQQREQVQVIGLRGFTQEVSSRTKMDNNH